MGIRHLVASAVKNPSAARREVVRRSEHLLRYLRSTYRPTWGRTLMWSEEMSLPLTPFRWAGRRLVHPFDWLPDRLSFAGRAFEECPQLDFARRYLGEDGFDFRKTQYYELAVKGRLPYPCQGETGAKRRCEQFIYMINLLKDQGYQPEVYSPIMLVRCGDGTLAVFDGKHRLSILMALGVEEFPVAYCFENECRAIGEGLAQQVWPRRFYSKNDALLAKIGEPMTDNKEGVESLRGFIRRSKLETWADVYHPLPFHEFRDLTTQVSLATPYRRLAMICKEYPDFRGLRVLDTGCNVGFYSFSLARRGAIVTGVDTRPEYHRITTELAKIYGLPVDFICEPLSPEMVRGAKEPYDLTLCFSMIQWVIAARGEAYGREVLRAISEKSRAMFFDVAVNAGKSCLICPAGEELAYSHRLLRESTCYTQIRHVGEVSPYGVDTRYVFYCSRPTQR